MKFAYIGSAQKEEEALEHLYQYHSHIAVDTETIALKGLKTTEAPEWDEDTDEESIVKSKYEATTLIGVGIAISETEAFYFPKGNGAWPNVPVVDLTPVEKVLSNVNTTHIYFNSIFDLERIEDAFDINVRNYADCAIACQVQGLWNALDQNVGHLLGLSHTVIDDVLPKGKTMLAVPFETTAFKCMMDCCDTFKLFNRMKLRDWNGKDPLSWTDHVGRKFDVPGNVQGCYLVDLQLIEVLRRMNRRGIGLKEEVVNRFYKQLTEELEVIDGYLEDLGIVKVDKKGKHILSNDDVGKVLAERGHYLGLTPSKKHYKVSENILEQISDPVAHLVLSRRRRRKLFGTYVDPLRERDRVYSHFRLDLATGRLASSDISLHTFPPKMREVFKADSGSWSWADINQAEMRVWAKQAEDDVMLKAFAEGSSPHVTTLNALFPGKTKKDPEYTDSKSFNFALLADASAEVLAKTTRKPVDMVQEYKRKMYDLYPATARHQTYMRHRKIESFYPDWVSSDFGRRCHIPDGIQVTYHHQEECRLNFPFQSTVADVIKRIMLGLNVAGYDFPIQLHDEILCDGTVEFPAWMSKVHPRVPMPFETNHGESWV